MDIEENKQLSPIEMGRILKEISFSLQFFVISTVVMIGLKLWL